MNRHDDPATAADEDLVARLRRLNGATAPVHGDVAAALRTGRRRRRARTAATVGALGVAVVSVAALAPVVAGPAPVAPAQPTATIDALPSTEVPAAPGPPDVDPDVDALPPLEVTLAALAPEHVPDEADEAHLGITSGLPPEVGRDVQRNFLRDQVRLSDVTVALHSTTGNFYGRSVLEDAPDDPDGQTPVIYMTTPEGVERAREVVQAADLVAEVRLSDISEGDINATSAALQTDPTMAALDHSNHARPDNVQVNVLAADYDAAVTRIKEMRLPAPVRVDAVEEVTDKVYEAMLTPPEPSPSTIAAQSPRLVATSPVTEGMTALLEDATVSVVDSCLGLTSSDGSQQVVSWHRGSELLDDPTGVRLPSGRELRIGDVISSGGGNVPAGDDAQRACPGVETVWMFGGLVDSD